MVVLRLMGILASESLLHEMLCYRYMYILCYVIYAHGVWSIDESDMLLLDGEVSFLSFVLGSYYLGSSID